MGGQGGCERRIEVFVKIQKKKFREWGGGVGGGGGVGVGLRGQSGCEQRIEIFFENSKKKLGGEGGGGSGGLGGPWGCPWRVRVDVNKELKFL